MALLANTPAQAQTLIRCLERAAAGIGLHVNADKTEYMCFNQRSYISTLNGSSLKLVNKFTYLGSSVSSTENDINTWQTKLWTAIDRLSVLWKSDLTDKIKHSGPVDTAIWMHYMNANKMRWKKSLTATTQECWEQYWTSHGGGTPQSSSCTATYHQSRKLVRRSRHAGHCWRSEDELRWHTPVDPFTWTRKGRTTS